MINIESLDHLVLTVADIERSCEFYASVLGMELITFAGKRKALKFGRQKINLHQQGAEFEPHAQQPLPGSADLCLLTGSEMPAIIQHLDKHGIEIETGPVQRSGACGAIESVYIRDPDQNLIEVARYL